MRLLQVITDTDRRGAQVFAVDLGRALAELGCDVTTVALRPGTGGALLDISCVGERDRSPLALLRLRRLMKSVDVTIAHGSSTLLACAMSALGTRYPWVYRQISDPLFWAGTLPRRIRVRRFLARATAVTALSERTADVLVGQFGVDRAKLTIIPNGVSGERFRPPSAEQRRAARRDWQIEDGQFVALYVGALVVEKGVAVGIEALVSSPNSFLLIAGEGPQRAELQALADGHAATRVRFAGSVSDVVPLYHAADVVIFPSLGGDSMPAALIESGLCGLPAICTAVGAATGVVLDQATGLVVPAGDAAGLAAAMNLLSNDAALRRRMGTAALEHCSAKFDIRSVANQWDAVLRQSVGRNGTESA